MRLKILWGLVALALLVTPARAHDRAVYAEMTVNLPVAEAWTWWTNEAKMAAWLTKARIDPKPGGMYEVYFAPDAPVGQRGSEGTHVLALQPEKMLSITWALPPYMPEVRAHLTHLSVRFVAVDATHTTVSVHHDGWGDGEKWDAAFHYFEKAWPGVLKKMADKTGQ